MQQHSTGMSLNASHRQCWVSVQCAGTWNKKNVKIKLREPLNYSYSFSSFALFEILKVSHYFLVIFIDTKASKSTAGNNVKHSLRVTGTEKKKEKSDEKNCFCDLRVLSFHFVSFALLLFLWFFFLLRFNTIFYNEYHKVIAIAGNSLWKCVWTFKIKQEIIESRFSTFLSSVLRWKEKIEAENRQRKGE